MLRECLVSSSMRLGVPFIAPRQLGAIESIPGRQFLPSVAWRTGQSGAPPDTVRCGSLSLFGEADRCSLGAVGAPDTVRCGSLSLFGEADHCSLGAVGAPDTVRCTPDSPVPHPIVGTCHASRADSTADRWPGRLLAHRKVRCTTGQSDDLLPYTAVEVPRAASSQMPAWRTGHCPVHHRTVRCTQTEHTFWLLRATLFQLHFL
jgi:hypothetical protein